MRSKCTVKFIQSFKMFSLFVLVVVVALCTATPTYLRKPRLEENQSRIVGGYEIDIEQASYQVSLRRTGRHICGGSIVHPKWVLTAAHCTDGSSASMLTIRAGSSFTTHGGEVVNVSRVVQHKRYNGNTIDFDYSLLELVVELELDETKQVVGLPEQDESVEDGTLCKVSGWGETQNNNESKSNLRAAFVPSVNQQKCDEVYAGFGGITNQMVCAGFREGGKDACQGDSGGPLVADDKLVGVVSWGYGCARPNYFGVYSRVASVRDWVTENSGV